MNKYTSPMVDSPPLKQYGYNYRSKVKYTVGHVIISCILVSPVIYRQLIRTEPNTWIDLLYALVSIGLAAFLLYSLIPIYKLRIEVYPMKIRIITIYKEHVFDVSQFKSWQILKLKNRAFIIIVLHDKRTVNLPYEINEPRSLEQFLNNHCHRENK